jgi:hypothetical protein
MVDPCPITAQLWWQWHPPVGSWIAVLAFLGVVVPWLFRPPEEMGRGEKAIWTLLMLAFFGLELRTLYLDRDEHDREQAHAECEQLERFGKIADKLEDSIAASRQQFGATMNQFTLDEQARQKEFDATMRAFSHTESANQVRFDKLINHEEQIADSLNGVLSPGNDPTPELATRCGYATNDTVIIYGKGDRALITEAMPVTLVRSKSRGILLTMSRLPNGNIALTGDVRGKDGKILVRLDPRGYVINHSGFLEVNKDQHSLLVTDDYGDEVLNLRYINPQVIRVSMPLMNTGGFQITCFIVHHMQDGGSISAAP